MKGMTVAVKTCREGARWRALAAALVALGAAGGAIAQDRLWIHQFGTPEADTAFRVQSDGTGGLFASGSTGGDLAAPNAGRQDAWLARYDASGAQLWMEQVGSPETDSGGQVAPDGSGGVYWIGSTQGALGGSFRGDVDAWFARYDSDGQRLWIRQIGTRLSDWGQSVVGDGSGGCFVSGQTGGALGGVHYGWNDGYLARYDGDGNQLWIRQIGTSVDDAANGPLMADGSGGVLVAGRTDGDLGGQNSGGRDLWVAQYDGDGNRLWIKQYAGAGGVAFVPSGGWFRVLGHDLERFDASGDLLWSRTLPLGPGDSCGLAYEHSGGVYFAGSRLSSGRFVEVFVGQADSDGNTLWLTRFASAADDQAYSVAAREDGGAFVCGATKGDLGGAPLGSWDAWLARFGDACPADIDGDGDADVNDFFMYLDLFAAGDPRADIDGDGDVDVNDFFAYLDAFAAGCA